MKKTPLSTMLSIVFLFCIGAASTASAQTFKTLADFSGSNGSSPLFMSLVQGSDGNSYGTTQTGGTHGFGTVFKVTPNGALTTLYSFCAQTNCTDGVYPLFGLILATDGNFYGATSGGGATFAGCYNNAGCGTVFKITQPGVLTTLHSFSGLDGDSPNGLIQAADGNFYSTTSYGGATVNIACYNNLGCGTVFKVTPKGTLTTIYNFCSLTNCADGDAPNPGVVQGNNGSFYGTTLAGGTGCSSGCGTVFAVTSAGMLTTLHNFADTGIDGGYPLSSLVQASSGNFYGTTSAGGANQQGTIFEVTPSGTTTTLHSFCALTNCADGSVPSAGLIQATDGKFYGTTSGGGANSSGTAFKVTSTGVVTTLYSFCAQSGCTDGSAPFPGLFQATNGTFYGTTTSGGTSTACTGGCGTVFSIAAGLGPFVETLPQSGKVGTKVIVLGNNLSTTTTVTFNGTTAIFKVVSNTEITTTVPTGATSGKVQVITSHGTLNGNVTFRVK